MMSHPAAHPSTRTFRLYISILVDPAAAGSAVTYTFWVETLGCLRWVSSLTCVGQQMLCMTVLRVAFVCCASFGSAR